jgi:hypothetical protein
MNQPHDPKRYHLAVLAAEPKQTVYRPGQATATSCAKHTSLRPRKIKKLKQSAFLNQATNLTTLLRIGFM